MTERDINTVAQEALAALDGVDLPAVLESLQLSAETINQPISKRLSELEEANPDELYPVAGELHWTSLTMPDALKTIREFSENLRKFAENGDA